MIWKLKELQSHDDPQVQIDGKWVPARPINWMHRTLWERAREAWAVFVGKAEAFVWPEGQ